MRPASATANDLKRLGSRTEESLPARDGAFRSVGERHPDRTTGKAHRSNAIEIFENLRRRNPGACATDPLHHDISRPPRKLTQLTDRTRKRTGDHRHFVLTDH